MVANQFLGEQDVGNKPGHKHLNRVMGANQTWNHAGNIAAALLAMAVVSILGFEATFYAFAGLAAFGAFVFTAFVPETSGTSRRRAVPRVLPIEFSRGR